MQSGAGAAAAGRGHHAPRCCHSRSVLTQTRDTDWWPGHQHQETESSESGSIPALYWSSIDWQYSAIQLVCHLHPQLPNVLHIRRNKLERRRKMLLNLKVEFAFHSDCCLQLWRSSKILQKIGRQLYLISSELQRSLHISRSKHSLSLQT